MQSASGTLWQADTIFGHLCWALRYLEGEKALTELLDFYKEGLTPFLLSNGFPGDFLPNPLLLPMPRQNAAMLKKEQLEQFRRDKKLRKLIYISPADFAKVLKGDKFNLDAYEREQDKFPSIKTRATLKNQINRLSGATGEEGQLYHFQEHFYDSVTIYTKIEQRFESKVRKLFEYLKMAGYGKKKSSGYGQIRNITFEPFPGFVLPPDANGFVSLSNFIPAHDDPVKGSWKLVVKYGKLSEGYATDESIFKKPLLMLEAGSTFYTSPFKDYYGKMVNDIARGREEVVQYGFALPVPMKLPPFEAGAS